MRGDSIKYNNRVSVKIDQNNDDKIRHILYRPSQFFFQVNAVGAFHKPK